MRRYEHEPSDNQIRRFLDETRGLARSGRSLTSADEPNPVRTFLDERKRLANESHLNHAATATKGRGRLAAGISVSMRSRPGKPKHVLMLVAPMSMRQGRTR